MLILLFLEFWGFGRGREESGDGSEKMGIGEEGKAFESWKRHGFLHLEGISDVGVWFFPPDQ